MMLTDEDFQKWCKQCDALGSLPAIGTVMETNSGVIHPGETVRCGITSVINMLTGPKWFIYTGWGLIVICSATRDFSKVRVTGWAKNRKSVFAEVIYQ